MNIRFEINKKCFLYFRYELKRMSLGSKLIPKMRQKPKSFITLELRHYKND